MAWKMKDSGIEWIGEIPEGWEITKIKHIVSSVTDIDHPQNTAHARIYDRLLEMCVPISCIGVSFRKETAQEKMERLKSLIG